MLSFLVGHPEAMLAISREKMKLLRREGSIVGEESPDGSSRTLDFFRSCC
jgi:hypothetical protein